MAGLVAEMGCSQPIEAIGQMFADSKPETALACSLTPSAHNVFLGTRRSGVPSRLVFGVPHVEVVMVDAHADEVFGTGLLVQIHQVFRIPAIGRELRHYVLEADR